jgi:beta-glucosidase
VGRKAPGVRDWPTALRVSHHLLLSHGLATQALRAAAPEGAAVGITLNLQPERPLTDSDADRAAALIADGHANRWFLDPVLRGNYPEDMLAVYGRSFGPPDSVLAGDLETIAQPLDFLGVNYYSPKRVSADAGAAPLGVRYDAPAGPLTTMGWEQDPAGLHEILVRIRRDYGDLPIWITENGAAFDDGEEVDGAVEDPARVAFLQRHIAAVGRAIADGVDVRRYFVWSLLDNFEWEQGYGPRFGIVHVDYPTQRRVPKRSALWYRDHIAAVRGAR